MSAKLIASRPTPLAYPTTKARVNRHTVADAETANVSSGRNHFACGVATKYQRRRELPLQPSLTLSGEYVQAVERAGANSNHHVTRAGRWVGPFAVLEDFHVTVGFDVNGFHR